jgi:hypothetical protein
MSGSLAFFVAFAILPSIDGIVTTAQEKEVPVMMRREAASRKADIDNGGHVRLSPDNREPMHYKQMNAVSVASAPAGKRYMVTSACRTFEAAADDACCEHKLTEQMNEHNTARVVCCNATGWGVPINDTEEDPCMGSVTEGANPYNVENAGMPMNWSAANSHCLDQGYRLCTFHEIYSGRTCNRPDGPAKYARVNHPGIKFDFCDFATNLVWTSTEGPCKLTTDSFDHGARCFHGEDLIYEEDNYTLARQTSPLCCDNSGIDAGYTWEHRIG